jgi:hypothetical protein
LSFAFHPNRWSRIRIFAVAAATLAPALIVSAAAQTIENGPVKVIDNGSLSQGYALKGVTGFGNDAGLFGYGTVSTTALNIDGVVGYVQSPQSVGVVGWAESTGTSSYGVYGYSSTGPGVYGYNNNGAVASIYGYSTSAGGTAMYGNSTGGVGVFGSSTVNHGVVGVTTSSASPGYAGVTGEDMSSTTNDAGVFGTSVMGNGVVGSGQWGAVGVSTSTTGYGLFGQGPTGVYGSGIVSGNGVGVVGDGGVGTGVIALGIYGVDAYTRAASGVAVSAFGTSLQTEALIGVGSGEGGIFYGNAGSASHPSLVAQQVVAGTDYFAAVNAIGGASNAKESFIVQAASANYSGDSVPTYGSDVQMSGDLYVQGRVYQLCSQGSGAAFPVASPAGHCSYDNDLTTAVHTRSAASGALTTYATQQTLPTVEDFGEAQLANGRVDVPLEGKFASTIDPTRSYLVFITPLGDCHGLYVAGRSANGFEVRELMNGRGNVGFQYRIVAHPYGDRSTRLPAAARPLAQQPTIASMPARPSAPHVSLKALLAAAPRLHPMKASLMPKRPPLPQVNAILQR